MQGNFLSDAARQIQGATGIDLPDTGELRHKAEHALEQVRDYLPNLNLNLPANVGQPERLISLALGGLLLTKGLAGRPFGLLSAQAGGALLFRGLSGHCSLYRALGINTAVSHGQGTGPATVIPAGAGRRVEHAITVARSPEELYRFWRRLENLPRVMSHLREVRETGGTRSHWVAKGPLGIPVEWDAEITNDTTNQTIAWKSVEGSTVDTAGSVHFNRSGDGRGTDVRVNLKFNPPAGKLGAAVARLLGENPQQQVREDLARFKQMIEAGENATAQA